MMDIFTLFNSIFYFIVAMIVALIYALFIVGVILYLKKCFTEKRIIAINISMIKSFFLSKTLHMFLLFFIGFNYFMYSDQRSKWIKKNTIHHNAKEYFVAYVPIAFYKKVLNIFVTPDSIIMKPFNVLSGILYNKGVSLLPKSDGEKYYWQYRIFNYWYIRGGGYMPDYDPYHPKPITVEQQKILDSMYEVAKGLATSKIKDKVINREKYKVFIAVLHYYVLKSWMEYNEYIINSYADAQLKALEDKRYVNKEKNILKWTLKFQNEYKKDEILVQQIEKSNPILGVDYLYILQDTIEVFVFKMIVENKLNCNSKYIQMYLKNSKKFIDEDSPLFKMSKEQQKLILKYAYQTDMAHLNKYIIYKQCKKKIGIGYPSKEWIKNVFPSIKEKWISDGNNSKNYLISIDTNNTKIIKIQGALQ